MAEAGYAGQLIRALHEQANPRHRLRVEHDAATLLIHLADEDGAGWTTIAVDRASRRCAVASDERQVGSARSAYEALYGAPGPSDEGPSDDEASADEGG